MSFYSYNRDELTERICRLVLGNWYEGSYTSVGTATTLVDTSRSEPDDFFIEEPHWLYIRTGTYKGSEARILDWTLSSTTGSFLPALGGAPASGDTYSIMRKHRRKDIYEAINAAIDAAAKHSLFYHRDETVQLATNLHEYALPEGFIYIHKITQADGDGGFQDDSPIPPGQYRIVKGVEPRLLFQTFPPGDKFEGHTYGSFWREDGFAADRYLRIEGLRRHPILTSDTDTCSINPELIVQYAGAMLLEDEREEDSKVRARVARDRADRLLSVLATTRLHLPPDSKKVVE